MAEESGAGSGSQTGPSAATLSRLQRVRNRVHEVVEAAEPGDRLSLIFDAAIIALIVITLVTLSLETVESIRQAHGRLLRWIEFVSLAAFMVEYPRFPR